MKWLFAGFVCLFLVVFQTVLLPFFPGAFYCFDLTIILIIYISLNSSHYLAVAAITGIGAIMDSLSGGPFFLYTFSYIWIFLIVHMARQFVFQSSILFVMVISLLAVAIQQGIFFISVFVRQDYTGIGSMDIALMLRQVALGGVMIPLGVGIISTANRRWQALIRRMIKNREQKRNRAHG
ncbi:MAG: rod shape-determining protein MreD [Desulfotignum sp.]